MPVTEFRRKLATYLSGKDHPPQVLARGVGLGLFIGLTPTTGIQIPILLDLRVLLGQRWRFHVPLSMLCTLPTNALTLPFVYYLYVVTGRVMLGRFERLRGFDTFANRLEQPVSGDLAWYQQFWQTLLNVLQEFGLPLVIGSLPWAIAGGVAGYMITLNIVTRRRKAASVVQAPTADDPAP